MVQKLKKGLSSEHFVHPLDKSGMQRLMDRLAQSGVKGQIEKLQVAAEEEFYILNLADNTRLNESQGRSVYRLVQEAAEILGVQVPHVFLDTSPDINAYALGGENPTIVLTSALVDSFPEASLRAVVAHELGHIICKHTFYRILAENFDQASKLLKFIPFLGHLISMSMRWPLFDWYRKSELSSDRVALLGTQDFGAVQDCVMRLAGGSSRLGTELKVQEFALQAKEFQERMKAKREAKLEERVSFLFSSFMLQHAMSSHPWPAVRLQEIRNWAKSKQYALLLTGDYQGALAATPSPTDEDQDIAPPGEDIKEYFKDLKDLGKITTNKITNFFDSMAQKGRAKVLAQEVRRGDTEAVKKLIDDGADVNAKDEDGKTPLMLAAEMGHRDIVKILLTEGAEVNAKDKDGFTALTLSIQKGHDEVAKILKQA
jgi:Zn-dependent protease with chaperone function